jgi:hypothetical protein
VWVRAVLLDVWSLRGQRAVLRSGLSVKLREVLDGLWSDRRVQGVRRGSVLQQGRVLLMGHPELWSGMPGRVRHVSQRDVQCEHEQHSDEHKHKHGD